MIGVVKSSTISNTMILIDILMNSFFVYVRKFANGKEGAIIGVSTIVSSILLFSSSVLLYLLGLSLLKLVGIIGFGLLSVIFYLLTNFLLTKIYIKKRRELLISDGVTWLYYLLGPISFTLSIFILFMSFKFM